MMLIVVLGLTVGAWMFIFRGRPIGLGKLAVLWVMLTVFPGSVLFVQEGLARATWTSEAFLFAALLTLIPILYLMGLFVALRGATSVRAKGKIRIAAGVLAMTSYPLLRILPPNLHRVSHDPEVQTAVLTLASGVYIMMAIGLVTLFMGLATVLRELADR
jgi:hypothetical protein